MGFLAEDSGGTIEGADQDADVLAVGVAAGHEIWNSISWLFNMNMVRLTEEFTCLTSIDNASIGQCEVLDIEEFLDLTSG